MIKFLKFLLAFICFFVLQNILEILLMAAFSKVGIKYMGFEGKGETFKESIEGISTYYSYSKLLYVVPAYFLLTMITAYYFYKNREVSIKNLAVINLLINVIIFLALWFGFRNGFDFITNPFLALLLAGLILYLLAFAVKRPIIGSTTRSK